MFDALGLWWEATTLWEKITIGYVILIAFTIAMFIWQHINKNPNKCLEFIKKATEDNCITIGKLTCLTLHGNGKPEHYQAEYMYVVDGKRYFVTYQMWHTIPVDDRREEMNADMLLLNLSNAMVLFYDKTKPSRVISKKEVFTSSEAFSQIYTPKKNVWRNTEIEWTTPINLVRY